MRRRKNLLSARSASGSSLFKMVDKATNQPFFCHLMPALLEHVMDQYRCTYRQIGESGMHSSLGGGKAKKTSAFALRFRLTWQTVGKFSF